MNSPLEQFNIIAILTFTIGIVSLTGTNNKRKFLYLSGYLSKWKKSITEVSHQLTADVIPQRSQKYLPVIVTLYFFIFFSNLIGLIPYTFTLTSHLTITFTVALMSFIGMNVLAVKKYGLKALSVFLPGNTPLPLALLLAPIEIISYFTKPISLGLRLFINLMAGHTLLKVVVGFAWNIVLAEMVFSLGFVFPMIMLVILFILELGVSLIQTYVFIVLTCIYIQDISCLLYTSDAADD